MKTVVRQHKHTGIPPTGTEFFFLGFLPTWIHFCMIRPTWVNFWAFFPTWVNFWEFFTHLSWFLGVFYTPELISGHFFQPNLISEPFLPTRVDFWEFFHPPELISGPRMTLVMRLSIWEVTPTLTGSTSSPTLMASQRWLTTVVVLRPRNEATSSWNMQEFIWFCQYLSASILMDLKKTLTLTYDTYIYYLPLMELFSYGLNM